MYMYTYILHVDLYMYMYIERETVYFLDIGWPGITHPEGRGTQASGCQDHTLNQWSLAPESSHVEYLDPSADVGWPLGI